MMTHKWLILDSPIKTKVAKAILLIQCIAWLHNYCINERLVSDGTIDAHTNDQNRVPSVPLDIDGDPIVITGSDDNYWTHGHSVTHEIIASNLHRRGLVRPLKPMHT
jgi:hypothetical protein